MNYTCKGIILSFGHKERLDHLWALVEVIKTDHILLNYKKAVLQCQRASVLSMSLGCIIKLTMLDHASITCTLLCARGCSKHYLDTFETSQWLCFVDNENEA